MSQHGPPGGYPDPYEPYRQQPPPGASPEYPGDPGYVRGGPDGGGGYDPGGHDPGGWYGSGAPPGRGAWEDLTTPQQPYHSPHQHPPGQRPPYPGQQGRPHPDEQTAYQPVYQDPAGYEERWEPPPRRRRTGWLVAVVVAALALVVAGGVFATLSWVDGGGRDDAAGGAPAGDTTSPAPTGSGSPQATEAATEERIGLSAVVAEVDDCLVNDGSDSQPELRIVACDEADSDLVYQVRKRVNEQVSGDTEQEWGRSAQQLCAGTEGYDFHYHLVADVAADSFVLCMGEY